MKKKVMYTELSYIFGIIILALGTALITKSDLGVSMIVAPAYLLHLKLVPLFPFFTFGMAEYTLQGLIIIVMCFVIRRFHLSYLFSFVTAVLYGLALDGSIYLTSFLSDTSWQIRLCWFVAGVFLATLGVAFFFHTYISPEAYELFVKKVSAKFGVKIYKFKMFYDLSSLALSFVMSLCFFGADKLVGIGVGTLVTALLNGRLIALWSSALEEKYEFRDRFPLKKHFDEE